MHTRRLLPCALPLLLAATPALAEEPTEAEMRTALEQHGAAANEENRCVVKAVRGGLL